MKLNYSSVLVDAYCVHGLDRCPCPHARTAVDDAKVAIDARFHGLWAYSTFNGPDWSVETLSGPDGVRVWIRRPIGGKRSAEVLPDQDGREQLHWL